MIAHGHLIQAHVEKYTIDLFLITPNLCRIVVEGKGSLDLTNICSFLYAPTIDISEPDDNWVRGGGKRI